MASIIQLNGWDLPVLDGSLERSYVIGGERGRRYGGSIRDHRRWTRDVYTGETPTLAPLEAKAVKRLLKGLGDRWDFSNAGLSYKGNAVETDANVTYPADSGRDGSGDTGMKVASSGTAKIIDSLSEPFWDGTWTCIFDYSPTAGSGFARYLVTDNYGVGAAYGNGTFSGYNIDRIFTFDTTNGFQFLGKSLSTGSNADAYFDNVVILPFAVTPGMAAVWSLNTNDFSALPFLEMQFANISAVVNVLGEAESSEYLKAYIDSTFYTNAQRVSFMLESTGAATAVAAAPSGSGFSSGFSSGFGV